jgi:hypothetical protein
VTHYGTFRPEQWRSPIFDDDVHKVSVLVRFCPFVTAGETYCMTPFWSRLSMKSLVHEFMICFVVLRDLQNPNPLIRHIWPSLDDHLPSEKYGSFLWIIQWITLDEWTSHSSEYCKSGAKTLQTVTPIVMFTLSTSNLIAFSVDCSAQLFRVVSRR